VGGRQVGCLSTAEDDAAWGKVYALVRGRAFGPYDGADKKAYVEATNGMLARHFLPGYEPELNPDELMWSHVKRTEMATAQLRRGEELQDKIMAQFAAIRRLPSPVRSFFLASNVAYIAYG
jgi:hypothetical protein